MSISDSDSDSDIEDFEKIEAYTNTITMPAGTVLYHIAPTEQFNMNKDEFYFGEKLGLCVKATWHSQRGKEDGDFMWLHVFVTTEDLKLLQEKKPIWRELLYQLNNYCNVHKRDEGIDGWHLKHYEDNSQQFYGRRKGIAWSDAEYETALFKLDKLQLIGKRAFTLYDLKHNDEVILNEEICLSNSESRKLRF